MGSFGERLRDERHRLGKSQDDFAAIGGVRRGAQINYEKDERQPDSDYLAAIAAAGADVLYIITGQRVNAAQKPGPEPINLALMERILDMLDQAAAKAGRVWPEKRKLKVAVEVYNFLLAEDGVDDAKIERVLKLVVNN